MQIVSDRGMDLTPEQLEGLDNIHLAPLVIILDGKTYVSGVDIDPQGFYELLEDADGLPTTSLPSPGDFAELYREIAQEDPDILSVHISSGLSSTINAAREGAKLVSEADIHFFDTLTLSGAEGWHVEAAARAAKAGWPLERIMPLLHQVRDATETLYTLPDLTYLIHGGRISHIKGLLASILNIKPLISVSKEDGRYYQRGQQRTMARAMRKIVDVMADDHREGAALRVQVLHANNPDGAEKLHALIEERFDCDWLSTGPIAPVLGAHTGPGLVGVVYADLDAYPALP